MKVRICSKCKEAKPLTNEFYEQLKNSFRNTCKDCRKEEYKMYYISKKSKRPMKETNTIRDRKEQLAYERMINESYDDLSQRKLDIDIIKGDYYIIEKKKNGTKERDIKYARYFEGKLIFVSDYFVVIENKNKVRESFCINDIKLNEIQIKRVGG